MFEPKSVSIVRVIVNCRKKVESECAKERSTGLASQYAKVQLPAKLATLIIERLRRGASGAVTHGSVPTYDKTFLSRFRKEVMERLGRVKKRYKIEAKVIIASGRQKRTEPSKGHVRADEQIGNVRGRYNNLGRLWWAGPRNTSLNIGQQACEHIQNPPHLLNWDS